jgi:hypothetical protein
MSRIARLLLSPPTLALLLFGPAIDVEAQSRPLLTGEEVRISWWDPSMPAYAFNAPRLVTAEVIDYSGDSVMLRQGSRVFTVRLSQTRSIQRRIGTKPASAPAMVGGSAAGFAAGFALGALTGGLEGGGADVDRVQSGLTTGVLIGAPLGAIVAWLASRSRGIYEDVPFGDMVAGLIADPDGRVGVSLKRSHR